MRRAVFIGLSFILWALPGLGSADCLDVRRMTGWYIEGSHQVTLYSGMAPIAFLDVPYCRLYSDSNIRILNPYLCDSDKLIVDGEECIISTVRSARSSPY